MKRYIILSLFAMLFLTTISAQDTYLHKRGRDHYEVLDPNSVYYAQQIDLETGKPVKPTRPSKVYSTPYKTEGYRGYFSAGYTFVPKHGNEGYVDISTTHGYQPCQYLFLGVGAGLDIHPTGETQIDIPVYGAIRLQPNHSKVTPFVECRIGYQFNDVFNAYEDTEKVGAFYMNPSIGLNFVGGENVGINLSIGYTLCRYKYPEPIGEYNQGGLSLRLGFEF